MIMIRSESKSMKTQSSSYLCPIFVCSNARDFPSAHHTRHTNPTIHSSVSSLKKPSRLAQPTFL